MTNQTFDFESLTLNEVEQIELITGNSIDQILDAGQAKGKAMKAIIYIMKKRIDPDFTLEQAGQISMTEANSLFAGQSDPKE
jgi:cellobiose-specific phosphotransferase system component IIA